MTEGSKRKRGGVCQRYADNVYVCEHFYAGSVVISMHRYPECDKSAFNGGLCTRKGCCMARIVTSAETVVTLGKHAEGFIPKSAPKLEIVK